jgi:inner membrane protein
MDPVTQAALGAAWAQPSARRPSIGLATAIGCIAGMAPDLDVLIRSSSDPLLALQYHRHFTHSLAFIPFGALLCALLLYPLLRRRLSFGWCYLFCFLGYASHGVLDACTSYGTMLLWPFSPVRIAWDVVSVVDPLVTLPLIGFVVASLLLRRPRLALAGVAWCAAYMALGLAQNHRATSAALALADERGHVPSRLTVKPAFGSIVLWKSIYEEDGHIHIDAVRVLGDVEIFPGQSLIKLNVERDFPWLDPTSQQSRDVQRFEWFADGYLALDATIPNRIVDVRYSLVPNRGDGLWAIELDPTATADSHAAYVTMRRRPLAEGRELLDMLFR